MARPKKQTVDYFPHYCSHKKTMFVVEQKYGNDGYAFWFKLLEMLGSTEGHFINCNDSATWEFLQAKTRVSEGFCTEILNLLSKLDAIDTNLWGDKIVWSQNFVDGISEVYRNRRVEIPIKPSFYRKKLKQAKVSTTEKPQSIVKETRVNKCTSAFEDFWEKYPSRNGKKLEKNETFDKFNQIEESDISLLLQAVKNYAESENVKKGIGIKDPKRFLKSEYWREWIEPEQRKFDDSNPSEKKGGRLADQYPAL